MRGLRPIGPLVWTILIVLVIIGLYFAGGAVSKQGTTIVGCRAEWDTIAHSVQSDLCPVANETCIAAPYIVQHNAIVDAIICACMNVAPDYDDESLNKQIEDAYKANTNATLSVREICEGGQLAKWAYAA